MHCTTSSAFITLLRPAHGPRALTLLLLQLTPPTLYSTFVSPDLGGGRERERGSSERETGGGALTLLLLHPTPSAPYSAPAPPDLGRRKRKGEGAVYIRERLGRRNMEARR
nr:unnamed protein product [Digitaria exilis]